MSFLKGFSGPPDIEKLKTKHDINGLVKALHYEKDAVVRQSAAEALGEFGDPRTVKPLSDLFQDSSDGVRLSAVMALGKIGGNQVVESLISRLQDTSKEVLLSAVKALGKIGDNRAVEPLIGRLQDKSQEVSLSAVESLRAIGDPQAVTALIAALEVGYDRIVREIAARALAEIGDTRAVAPLVGMLGDEYEYVREEAEKALSKFGISALEQLIPALKQNNSHVRKQVASLLGQIGDGRAIKPLLASLKDNSELMDSFHDVYQDSMEWFQRQPNGQVVDDKKALEHHLSVLKDREPIMSFSRVAADSLDNLGWRPGQDENGSYYWIAKQECNKCIEIGPPAVEPLIAALKDINLDVRKGAAEALGQIGDPRAVEPLIAALKCGGSCFRLAAAKALDMYQWNPVHDEDQAYYWLAKEKWDKCIALGKSAVEPLVAICKDEGWSSIAKQCIKSIIKVGDQKAAETVFEAYYAGCTVDKLDIEYLEMGTMVIGPIKRALVTKPESPRECVSKLEGILDSPRLAMRIPLDVLDELAVIKDGKVTEMVHVDSDQDQSPDAMYASPGWDEQQEVRIDCSKIRSLAKQEGDRRKQKSN